MGLVDSGRPQWSMYVPPSADIVLLGPRPAQPDPEHDLFESLIVELTDIYGIEVEYYPLNPNFADKIYGEHQNAKYYGPFTTKVIYRPGDEPNLFTIFGDISDELIDAMILPQYSFWRDVKVAPFGPNPGDIIRVDWNKSQTGVQGLNVIFYELTGLCDTANTFLALKFTYELKVRPMRAGEGENVVSRDVLKPDTGTGDTLPLSAWGDNVVYEEEHKKVDDYAGLKNIDELYGY